MCAVRPSRRKRDSFHRYSDDARIDESRVPERFRHLVPLAKYWSIGDDVDRARLMAKTSLAKKKALVDAVRPLWSELSEWCEGSHGFATPVPDEVVVFETLFEAVAEAEVEVYPPAPRPPPPPPLPEPTLSAKEKAELQGYISQLARPASRDFEHDYALVQETMKRIQAFWARVLREQFPALPRERIEEQLGIASTAEGPREQFRGVPEPLATTLAELRARVDAMLAQCDARRKSRPHAGHQPPATEPGAAPNSGPSEPLGGSGVNGGPPSVS